MSVDRVILDRLAAGRFVSGSELAAQAGVSRAAINQHVARMRDDGIEIHGVRGRGYRLAVPLGRFDAARIAALAAASLDVAPAVAVLERVDSTNRWLASQRAAGEPVDAVFAEYQTAGRGRRGRDWLSAPYGSILMSVAHRLAGGPAASSGLSLAAGVAVVRALDAEGIDGCGLKWPNDLVAGSAKLGGILVEIAGELGESCTCIIGIGLNVTLPPRLAGRLGQPAADLAGLAGRPLDRNRLAASLLASLVRALAEFDRGGFAPFAGEWETRHAHHGQLVRVVTAGETVDGVAVGVTGSGALKLATGAGERVITTGEVQA